MKIGSLFTGVGGLDLGLELASHEIIWQAESDKAASTILAKHWPDTPNLGDVRTVKWTNIERPDIVAAGFPCPSFSAAGRKRGFEEEQGQLWFEVARCLRILNPMRVLLENVPGIFTASGLAEHPGESAVGVILADLAEIGYDAQWTCLRASDFGACHRRERWLVIAYATGAGGRQESGGASQHEAEQNGSAPEANYFFGSASQGKFRTAAPTHTASVAGSASRERHGRSGAGTLERSRGTEGQTLGGATGRAGPAPDAVRDGLERQGRSEQEMVGEAALSDTEWGFYWPAIFRWERIYGRSAPRPADAGRLRPEFVEWMMGLDEGWTEGVAKTHRLRCLGNSVFIPIAEHLGKLI